jgi:hypothetical protein
MERFNDYFESEEEARLAWSILQMIRLKGDLSLETQPFPEDTSHPHESYTERLIRTERSLRQLWKQFGSFQRMVVAYLDQTPPQQDVVLRRPTFEL